MTRDVRVSAQDREQCTHCHRRRPGEVEADPACAYCQPPHLHALPSPHHSAQVRRYRLQPAQRRAAMPRDHQATPLAHPSSRPHQILLQRRRPPGSQMSDPTGADRRVSRSTTLASDPSSAVRAAQSARSLEGIVKLVECQCWAIECGTQARPEDLAAQFQGVCTAAGFQAQLDYGAWVA